MVKPDDGNSSELIPRGAQTRSLARRTASIAARGLQQSQQLLAGKLLTNEIAEQYLQDRNSVDLEEFTAIEDEAADCLSRSKGHLSLDGLTSLSDVAARSLSKNPMSVSLDGLTSLSDAAAESLSKHEGYLTLDGLTSLSDVAAESLSKYEGGLWLDLEGLPASAAEILRQHPSLQYE